MFVINKVAVILTVLLNTIRAANSIKCLIFDNDNDSVRIEFVDPIIIENVFLLKKVNESDSAHVLSLNNGVDKPSNYFNSVMAFKKTPAKNKNYRIAMREAQTSYLDISLPTDVFDKKTTYLFKITEIDEQSELFSEEFVYKDKKFMHKSAEGRGWYASAWPWIAIGFIILTAILLLKIVFC